MGKWLTCFSFLPDHPPSPLLHEPDHAAPQQADHPPRAALAFVKLIFFLKKGTIIQKHMLFPNSELPPYILIWTAMFFLDHNF